MDHHLRHHPVPVLWQWLRLWLQQQSEQLWLRLLIGSKLHPPIHIGWGDFIPVKSPDRPRAASSARRYCVRLPYPKQIGEFFLLTKHKLCYTLSERNRRCRPWTCTHLKPITATIPPPCRMHPVSTPYSFLCCKRRTGSICSTRSAPPPCITTAMRYAFPAAAWSRAKRRVSAPSGKPGRSWASRLSGCRFSERRIFCTCARRASCGRWWACFHRFPWRI